MWYGLEKKKKKKKNQFNHLMLIEGVILEGMI